MDNPFIAQLFPEVTKIQISTEEIVFLCKCIKRMDEVFSHEFFMKAALREAEAALEEKEVPVGAVVVCENRIIGKGHNLTQRLHDVTAHAEMQAITAASDFLNGKYLNECTLYVTLEPCVMCAGALFWSQIGQVVFGASDDKRGYQRLQQPILHPRTQVVHGVMQEECATLLQEFFSRVRNK